MADPADTPSQHAKEEAVRRVNARSTTQYALCNVNSIFHPSLYELALSIDREGVVFTEEEREKARQWLANKGNPLIWSILQKIADTEPVDPLEVAIAHAQCTPGALTDEQFAGHVRAALAEAGYTIVKTAQQSGEAK